MGGVNQPLSLALSFGEIPWFGNRGEIRRCDWLKIPITCVTTLGSLKNASFSTNHSAVIFPQSSNHGISPNDSASDRGWLTPPTWTFHPQPAPCTADLGAVHFFG